jgi:undecaprenyl-diphosphatase
MGFGREQMDASQEPAGAGFDEVRARCVENLRRPIAIVHRRFERRPPLYPPTPWLSWTLAVLLLAGICVVLFDDAAGRYWQHWPSPLKVFAEETTPLGLGKWYLLPPLAWLLVANQIDWDSLSRERLVAAYNRTCLSFFVLIAVGLPGLATLGIKLLVGRERPFDYQDAGILSFHTFKLSPLYASFPSGHSTTVGAVAGVIMLLCPRWKYGIMLAAIWIASTRVLLGAHYPSDAVTGFGLGLGLSIMTAQVFARLGFLFRQTPASLPVLRRSMRAREHSRDRPRQGAPATDAVLPERG